MRYNFGDAAQQAMTFLTQQTSTIEAEVLRVRYPDVQYRQLVPIVTAGNEWAKSITYFGMDQFGQADWFNHMARDIPLADVERMKFERTIEMAGIGYRYTLEELGQAMMIPGNNLPADKAAAARRAYEEFVDRIVLRGDTGKAMTGLINDAGATAVTVPNDGTGPSTLWATKTNDQVIRDFNSALTAMWTFSLGLEMADTVLLPMGVINALAGRQIPNTDITVLEWINRYNVYTQQTGQRLTIRAVRGLETAGAGGLQRMVAYRNAPDVLRFYIPMPHRFLPVWQTGPITFDVPGIFRLGGLEIRRPTAFRYLDGI